MSRIANKVALVTGGASGLGVATCQRLAEEDATVIMTDINRELGEKNAADIGQDGLQIRFIQQDVCNEAQWNAIIKQIVKEQGRLDVLVNNAGIAIVHDLEKATSEEWDRTQEINGKSVFFGTREAIKAMKETGGGSIINISSVEGIVGEPMASAYNFSKGGVRIFTKSAALHCAERGYRIRVNSIHPGFMMTPMAEAAAQTPAGKIFVDSVTAKIPVGHWGEALDIANGVLFLASNESKYITGSELVIDGGYTCQ